MNLVAALGIVTFVIGVWLEFHKEQIAQGLFQLYSRRRPQGRAALLGDQVATPADRVCLFVATAFGFLTGSAGLALFVVSGVEVRGAVLGTVVVVAGTNFLVQRKATAQLLFRFYNRPRREGPLAFLDRRIATPGERECLFLATVFAFVTVGAGLALIVGDLA